MLICRAFSKKKNECSILPSFIEICHFEEGNALKNTNLTLIVTVSALFLELREGSQVEK
jgi:hypothetical protein